MAPPDYALPLGQTPERAAYLAWVLELLPSDILGFCETHSVSPDLIVNLPIAKVESQNDVAGEAACFFRAAREHGDAFGAVLAAGVGLPLSAPEDLRRGRAFYERAVWGLYDARGRARSESLGAIFPQRFLPEATRFECAWGDQVPDLRRVICRLKMVAFEARPPVEVLRIYCRTELLLLVVPECEEDLTEAAAERILDAESLVLLVVDARSPFNELMSGAKYDAKDWRVLESPGDLGLRAFANYPAGSLRPSLMLEAV